MPNAAKYNSLRGRQAGFRCRCHRYFRRRQQPRASAQNSAIGPTFFIEKENLSSAGIAVIPPRDNPKMFTEFTFARRRGLRSKLRVGHWVTHGIVDRIVSI